MVGPLYKDKRFYSIMAANILSSVGSGITMIAIPWLLVSEIDGGTIFGYITILMTAVNFIAAPMIGDLVDRMSRKTLLLGGELLGLTVMVSFAAYGLLGHEYELWHYIILYGTGSFYYTLFYPAIFAFIQEIFDKRTYQSLNGAMEIQGQISSVIGGALAALLLNKMEIHWLLLFDAITYLASYILFKAIPYIPIKNTAHHDSFLLKISEGYNFMKEKPQLFWFLLASYMPFIGVMVTNYVFPVYLSQTLKAEASVYGTQSMVYGIGAVLAGIFIPFIARKWGNYRSIAATVFIYTVTISTVVLTTNIAFYFFLTVMLAFGNAGTRVARNSFMMERVPNHIMGRVDSLFRTIGLLMRLILLTVFTELSVHNSIYLSFYFLSILLVSAFVIIIISGKVFLPAALNIRTRSH